MADVLVFRVIVPQAIAAWLSHFLADTPNPVGEAPDGACPDRCFRSNGIRRFRTNGIRIIRSNGIQIIR
jgi:hypothetical protein